MNKLQWFKPVFVQKLPKPRDGKFGELYISRYFHVAGFLCPCGCGQWQTISFAPRLPMQWNLIEQNGKITIRPSIGCFEIPCKSHFFITENHIDWV